MNAQPTSAALGARYIPCSVFVGGTSPWPQPDPATIAANSKKKPKAKKAEQPKPPMTTAHLSSSPFRAATSTPAGKPGPKPGGTNKPKVDIGTLKIRKGMVPPTTGTIVGKYAPFFAKMQPKDAIECRPDEVDCIDQALRKYLKDTKQDDKLTVLRAKGTLQHPTTGFVWLWPREEMDGYQSRQSMGGTSRSKQLRVDKK